MKKKQAPLGKRNEARRKAEAKELFQAMLNSHATVVIPNRYKGSRSANIRKAISESY